jgi:outer membrane protein OmpA-like peptidoglycan-associated protein
MMKNKFLIILTACISLNASASFASTNVDNSIGEACRVETSDESAWRDNWFVNVAGGTNAFIGSPMGCNDLFGRVKPTFQVNFGKWFTPRVGSRLVYTGMWLKDCNANTQRYHQGHLDLLWNPLASYSRDRLIDIVPYVGAGLMHNSENGNNSFALSYGLIGRCRLSQRVHLTMELGGNTTLKNFDGNGKSQAFGDHILNLTAGLSVTIGRTGWRHAAVVGQYDDCEWHGSPQGFANCDEQSKDYRKNDYSGLNSLMDRLNGGKQEQVPTEMFNSNDYFDDVFTWDKCIGSPVYMFFKLGTTNLTDESQLINIDAIAKVAKVYGLIVKVYGAADSATGNDEINDKLSQDRAMYISSQLRQRGVSDDSIVTVFEGGIDDYTPTEANRNTRIELHFEQ